MMILKLFYLALNKIKFQIKPDIFNSNLRKREILNCECKYFKIQSIETAVIFSYLNKGENFWMPVKKKKMNKCQGKFFLSNPK